MGLDSLQGRRDKAKLKWWYTLDSMPGDRYINTHTRFLARFGIFNSVENYKRSLIMHITVFKMYVYCQSL